MIALTTLAPTCAFAPLRLGVEGLLHGRGQQWRRLVLVTCGVISPDNGIPPDTRKKALVSDPLIRKEQAREEDTERWPS
jgi:hypothetical protein